MIKLQPPIELRKVCEVPTYHGTIMEDLIDHTIRLTTDMHKCAERDKKRNQWYESNTN
ncbi:hypothetical protein pD_gene0067 [Vibrio phage 033B]|nr:hypothetical protein pD_gene0067 [Vibrio phage 033B]